MAETLLPTAMVPGLVTIEDKDGKRQNVYPIDAKELIATGDYKLVDNGCVEAARVNANPLKSGRATEFAMDQIMAEVTGVEGRVVASSDPALVEEALAASAGPDGTGPDPKAAKADARESDRDSASRSAAQPKTEAEKEATKAPAKTGDDKK